MKWNPFDAGKSIGQRGSENGVIIRDEEHADGARITLERETQTAPFTITCGIYGWMVHTHFIGTESEAQSDFESMKVELSRIISSIPLAADPEVPKTKAVYKSLSNFVKKFR